MHPNIPTHPRVSFILCVHNAAGTIRRTLECLEAASLPDCEVLVADDASTDATAEICSAFPVRLLRLSENRGPAAARNAAVRHARADTLFFLDSDVTFDPDVPSRILACMAAEPELAGVGTVSAPEPLNPGFCARYFAIQEYLLFDRLFDLLGQARLPYICTRCGTLKRNVFDETGGFDASYRHPSIEDYEFSLRLRPGRLVLFDRSLLNRHHFPDSPLKIIRRYARNTAAMLRLLRRLKRNTLGPFGTDALSRALVGLSGLFLAGGLFLPPLLPLAAAVYAAAGLAQRRLLGFLWRHEGPGFALMGWLLYTCSTLGIAAGLARGLTDPDRAALRADPNAAGRP